MCRANGLAPDFEDQLEVTYLHPMEGTVNAVI